MSGNKLTSFAFLLSFVLFGSAALAIGYAQQIEPDPMLDPNIDPVIGIEPKEPSADLPIRSIMPVEPMPAEPMDPRSDQPVRSILPVEPMPAEPVPNVLPVEPMIDPVAGPDPVLLNPNALFVNNPMNSGGSDLPGWVFFPVEPIILEPPVSLEPVAPIIAEPRAVPPPLVVDGPGRGNYPVMPGIVEPRENPRSPVPPVGRSVVAPEPGRQYNPRPVEPNPKRIVYKPGAGLMGPGMEPDGGQGANMPVSRPVIAPEPGRQYNPRPVEPSPKRVVYKPGPVQQVSRNGVESQYNQRIAVPIIVPNPLVSQSARIGFQAGQMGSGRVEVSVIDLAGKVVMRSEMPVRRDGIYEVDFGRLSNGAYLLRMAAPGVEAARKLVVQR